VSNYTTMAVMLTAALLTASMHSTFADDDLVTADAKTALNELYASEPAAKMISERAAAILVFPNVVKAGFIAGGHSGEGALLRDGKLVAHYNSAAAYSLQAGVQPFGYALFLMNDKPLQYLDSSDGWELGFGPTIVIVDEGKAKSLTTVALKDDVYAFILK
jgi:lipid-binding SYLF domain-containing protein